MPNLDQDRHFLDAGVQVLSDYLLSQELFYPLGGDLPRLTLGNLLLAQRRLTAAGSDLHKNEIATIREKWQVAWEQKASREVHTRLELWRNFLSEYRSSAAAQCRSFSSRGKASCDSSTIVQRCYKRCRIGSIAWIGFRAKREFVVGRICLGKTSLKGI